MLYNELMNEITQYEFFKKLQQLPFIKEIWLFGSRARGDAQKRADIDLAINCPNVTENDWDEILKIIEDSDTLLKIDCVRLDTLDQNSELLKSIKAQGIMLYKL